MVRDPVFLGIAEHFAPDGAVSLHEGVDVSRLRAAVLSHIFPLDLRGFVFVFALPAPPAWTGTMVISLPGGAEVLAKIGLKDVLKLDELEQTWLLCPVSLRSVGLVPSVIGPGTVTARVRDDSGERLVGSVRFDYVRALELTPEQLLAVESNPLLNRAVRLDITCNSCGDGITPYCALTSDIRLTEANNPVWYRDLPDSFRCSCGLTSLPLLFLKESMHFMLTQDAMFLPSRSVSFKTEVSWGESEAMLEQFGRLLNSEPREEDVQRFIQEHPLLLAPFGACYVFFKPPLLNRFFADFGIVNSRRELLLIEIERPNLTLLRADGCQTADLSTAFSQALAWKQVVADHKRAVLDCIPNCPKDISRVRYLVVAGRSQPYADELISRLILGSMEPEFMTYDHLIESVRGTVRTAMGQLHPDENEGAR